MSKKKSWGFIYRRTTFMEDRIYTCDANVSRVQCPTLNCSSTLAHPTLSREFLNSIMTKFQGCAVLCCSRWPRCGLKRTETKQNVVCKNSKKRIP